MKNFIIAVVKLVCGLLAFVAVANIHRLDDVVRSVFYPVEYKSPIFEIIEKQKQQQQP